MLTHLKYKGEQQEIKKEAEKLQNESKAFLKKHVSPLTRPEKSLQVRLIILL